MLSHTRQNKLFRCNQKALYQELGGKERSTQVQRKKKRKNSGVNSGTVLPYIKRVPNG